ncbi:MAG: hypothetical protein DRN96_08210 [Thermoproteota archaeon]|nr:MAG: hypothetical protein DRN96_08210 [Candidatus Korarchaeota archaeon]
MKLASFIASQARRKRSRRWKAAALLLGLAVYGLLIPLALVYTSLYIDSTLDIKLPLQPLNTALAIPLLAAGLLFMLWSAWAQWSIGKGSPVPIAPTQKLVVTGPYRYCRNPMLLGTALYYLSLALFTSSPTGAMLTALIAALLALYVKLVEEKELELRFGEEYLRYKKTTPFLIPSMKPGKHSVKTQQSSKPPANQAASRSSYAT